MPQRDFQAIMTELQAKLRRALVGAKLEAFNYDEFRKRAEQIASRYSGSLDEFINGIFPQLKKEFPQIERFGSKGDKIRLPTGEVIDAVLSAGLGGRGYNFAIEGRRRMRSPEEYFTPEMKAKLADHLAYVLQYVIGKTTSAAPPQSRKGQGGDGGAVRIPGGEFEL